ncbi:hypothetical protein HDU96_010033 [Phlyctochytrium bullatum]|nr:hypothetical protein HDU96_010033 [Phlyctochytrium bullatum]
MVVAVSGENIDRMTDKTDVKEMVNSNTLAPTIQFQDRNNDPDTACITATQKTYIYMSKNMSIVWSRDIVAGVTGPVSIVPTVSFSNRDPTLNGTMFQTEDEAAASRALDFFSTLKLDTDTTSLTFLVPTFTGLLNTTEFTINFKPVAAQDGRGVPSIGRVIIVPPTYKCNRNDGSPPVMVPLQYVLPPIFGPLSLFLMVVLLLYVRRRKQIRHELKGKDWTDGPHRPELRPKKRWELVLDRVLARAMPSDGEGRQIKRFDAKKIMGKLSGKKQEDQPVEDEETGNTEFYDDAGSVEAPASSADGASSVYAPDHDHDLEAGRGHHHHHHHAEDPFDDEEGGSTGQRSMDSGGRPAGQLRVPARNGGAGQADPAKARHVAAAVALPASQRRRLKGGDDIHGSYGGYPPSPPASDGSSTPRRSFSSSMRSLLKFPNGQPVAGGGAGGPPSPVTTPVGGAGMPKKKRHADGKKVVSIFDDDDEAPPVHRPKVNPHGPPDRDTGGSSRWAPPHPPGLRHIATTSHLPEMEDEVAVQRGETVVVERYFEDGWCRVRRENPRQLYTLARTSTPGARAQTYGSLVDGGMVIVGSNEPVEGFDPEGLGLGKRGGAAKLLNMFSGKDAATPPGSVVAASSNMGGGFGKWKGKKAADAPLGPNQNVLDPDTLRGMVPEYCLTAVTEEYVLLPLGADGRVVEREGMHGPHGAVAMATREGLGMAT